MQSKREKECLVVILLIVLNVVQHVSYYTHNKT